MNSAYMDELQVVAENRGGVVVDIEGLRGFVPFSHMTSVEIPLFRISFLFMDLVQENKQNKFVLFL